jgi:hypothetical protein
MPRGNKGRSIIGGSLPAPALANPLAGAASVGDARGADQGKREKDRVCSENLLYLSADARPGSAH